MSGEHYEHMKEKKITGTTNRCDSYGAIRVQNFMGASPTGTTGAPITHCYYYFMQIALSLTNLYQLNEMNIYLFGAKMRKQRGMQYVTYLSSNVTWHTPLFFLPAINFQTVVNEKKKIFGHHPFNFFRSNYSAKL